MDPILLFLSVTALPVAALLTFVLSFGEGPPSFRFRSWLYAVLSGILLAFVFQCGESQGWLLHCCFIFFSVIGLVMSLLFLVPFLLFRLLWPDQGDGTLARFTLVWCVLALGLTVSGGLGQGIYTWRTEAAQAYAFHALPLLDEIKARQGYYPAVLPSSLLGNPPALLRTADAYKSTGDSFRFQYWDGGIEPQGWRFTSETRAWNFVFLD